MPLLVSFITITVHGEISIALESWHQSADLRSKKFDRLIFQDTGLGISLKKIGHIFERFYPNKDHGTGIGLAFCRSTIQKFGGSIECESSLGEHTTFTISLPVMQP